MSKGGGAAQELTPATSPTGVPQTNALQHLLDMLNSAKPKGDQAMPGGQGTPFSASMPVMDPKSWTQQGAGNFMPSGGLSGGSAGGKGGQAAGAGGSGGKGGGAAAGGA